MFIDLMWLYIIIAAICAGVAWLALLCYDTGWKTGFDCCEKIVKISRGIE